MDVCQSRQTPLIPTAGRVSLLMEGEESRENSTSLDSIFQVFYTSFGAGGVVASCSPAEESATK